MIEATHAIALWLGYATMMLGAGLVLGMLAVFAFDRLFAAARKAYGITVVWAALRAWHKAHPKKSSVEDLS